MTHNCRVCAVELDKDNWYPSHWRMNNYICKECHYKRTREWKRANADRVRELRRIERQHKKENPGEKRKNTEAYDRRQKSLPFNENKECSQYLGVHVAERVLSNVFKDVEMMPMNNPGYDFVCNKGKRVDVKSSCLRADGRWMFNIYKNVCPDYFLCMVFDDIESLNVLHAWLLPGKVCNHLASIAISPTSISKWSMYEIDATKISNCCEKMKNGMV